MSDDLAALRERLQGRLQQMAGGRQQREGKRERPPKVKAKRKLPPANDTASAVNTNSTTASTPAPPAPSASTKPHKAASTAVKAAASKSTTQPADSAQSNRKRRREHLQASVTASSTCTQSASSTTPSTSAATFSSVSPSSSSTASHAAVAEPVERWKQRAEEKRALKRQKEEREAKRATLDYTHITSVVDNDDITLPPLLLTATTTATNLSIAASAAAGRQRGSHSLESLERLKRRKNSTPEALLLHETRWRAQLSLLRQSGERDKADTMEAERAMQHAQLKARGVSVKNDVHKLKRTIKKRDKSKEASSKLWKKRTTEVKRDKKQRIAKRQENINNKIQKVKDKKFGGGGKKASKSGTT